LAGTFYRLILFSLSRRIFFSSFFLSFSNIFLFAFFFVSQ
jgi:hypothetical protein